MYKNFLLYSSPHESNYCTNILLIDMSSIPIIALIVINIIVIIIFSDGTESSILSMLQLIWFWKLEFRLRRTCERLILYTLFIGLLIFLGGAVILLFEISCGACWFHLSPFMKFSCVSLAPFLFVVAVFWYSIYAAPAVVTRGESKK